MVCCEAHLAQERKLRPNELIFIFFPYTTCSFRYLPVYLWKEKCKREDKETFREHLRVLSNSHKLDMETTEVSEVRKAFMYVDY